MGVSDDLRAAAWDRYWATVEGQLGAGPSGFVRWALPFLHSAPGNDLVELGVGAARDMRFLLENGFQVRGVDFSHEAVRIAQQLLGTIPPALSSRGRIELGEAEAFLRQLPADGVAGVVGLVLYQTFAEEELPPLFDAVHRALRPGGFHLWGVRDDSHPFRERAAMVPPNQGGPAEALVPHIFFSEPRCDALSRRGFERVRLERRPETHYLFVADRKPGGNPIPGG
jgi:SAM-dependent methyltransferase